MGTRLERNIVLYIEWGPAHQGCLERDALSRRALPWLRRLPERFQEEIEGLAEGAGVPPRHLAE